jgi:hypothetical protein
MAYPFTASGSVPEKLAHEVVVPAVIEQCIMPNSNENVSSDIMRPVLLP